MICPSCNKPYLFIEKTDKNTSKCMRCGYSEPFTQPGYENYHTDKYSKPYRRDVASDPQMRRIFHHLKLKQSDVVLDLGCGVGDYTKAIHDYSHHVTGIDLSVQGAQKKFPHITFQAHDLNTELPFADSTFDVVISINLIEHLKDTDKFIEQCTRILKPEGRLAISTANLDFILHNWFYDATHLHEWTLKQFTHMLKKHFHIEIAEKSSSMFNFYPLNHITTKFLKPDLLIIGTK